VVLRVAHRLARIGAISAGGVAAVVAATLLAGCASTAPVVTPHDEHVAHAPPAGAQTAPLAVSGAAKVEALEAASAAEERYGIRYESLRLSGAGLLLDFRYRVVDPAKAGLVVNRKVQPYVQDKATGHQFHVPHAQKVGTLRHMGGNLQVGRVYSMLFANPGRTIKSGDKVSVVVGAYRLDEVAVQ
jgi:hypothetical protein